MIGFDLTEEQRQLQEMAHAFAEKEIRPVAAEYDEKEEFPWPILEQANRVGLLSYAVPEEYGGIGADTLTDCIVQEELFWGCAGIASAMGVVGLAATPIERSGARIVASTASSNMIETVVVSIGG